MLVWSSTRKKVPNYLLQVHYLASKIKLRMNNKKKEITGIPTPHQDMGEREKGEYYVRMMLRFI